jgi:hypothetical protein
MSDRGERPGEQPGQRSTGGSERLGQTAAPGRLGQGTRLVKNFSMGFRLFS